MSLVNYLIEGLLPEEEKKKVVAVYGGGFKPPTSGHFTVVKQALDENPEIDEMLVFVGKKERDGITQEESLKIWEIYGKYLPFKVKYIKSTKPPIQSIYNVAKENPESEVIWIIGAREGNEQDFSDIASRTAGITKYSNLELRTIVTKGGTSGTAARNAAKISPEKLNQFIPNFLSEKEKTDIFVMLNNTVTETIFAEGAFTNIETLEISSNKNSPEDGKAAPYGSGYNEVGEGRKKKKDPKKGTGKKPKGSSRRLYTDEDPKDTVGIKFSTRQDIVDTLNKTSFKSKSHTRQSQIINLIHQRVRAAYGRAKDPAVKKRLKIGLDYITKRKEASKKKTQRLNKQKVNENASYSQNIDIMEKIAQLTNHMIDKGMNIEPLPTMEFIDGDSENAKNFFGKTAYYDPNRKHIVLYTEGRHPKDIVRSYAHEMIHHIQNLEGRLGDISTTNTQEDDKLNDIEAEANLKGTMTFRNWTDSLNENISPLKNHKVYHSTDSKFEDFSLDYAWDGFWFTDDLDSLKNRTAGASGGKYILTRYITLKNPAGWDEYDKYSIGELIDMGYDGAILPDSGRADYLVFNPKSISKNVDSLQENKNKDPFDINAYAMELGRLREEETEYKIYCDMDGVIADFERGYEELTGIDLQGEFQPEGAEFWDPIQKAGVGYWAGLKWMPDGKQLWDYIKPYKPKLLSAPSRDQSSRIGKHVWVKHKIPGTPLILRYANKKKELASPTSILIDDRQKNIDDWVAAGGIGILHTNTANTIKELQKLGL